MQIIANPTGAMHLRLSALACVCDLLHPPPRPSEAGKLALRHRPTAIVQWGALLDHSFKALVHLPFFGFYIQSEWGTSTQDNAKNGLIQTIVQLQIQGLTQECFPVSLLALKGVVTWDEVKTRL